MKNGVETEKKEPLDFLKNCSILLKTEWFSQKLFSFLFPISDAALSLMPFIGSRGQNKCISAHEARINTQISPLCKIMRPQKIKL
jgi:hypothetical protein